MVQVYKFNELIIVYFLLKVHVNENQLHWNCENPTTKMSHIYILHWPATHFGALSQSAPTNLDEMNSNLFEKTDSRFNTYLHKANHGQETPYLDVPLKLFDIWNLFWNVPFISFPCTCIPHCHQEVSWAIINISTYMYIIFSRKISLLVFVEVTISASCVTWMYNHGEE